MIGLAMVTTVLIAAGFGLRHFGLMVFDEQVIGIVTLIWFVLSTIFVVMLSIATIKAR